MYNFGIPSQLKAWIDCLAAPGKTFKYSATGVEGLAGGKKLIIASSRGGYPEVEGGIAPTVLAQLRRSILGRVEMWLAKARTDRLDDVRA
jgi:FMN-dependent NADH-azoreductase